MISGNDLHRVFYIDRGEVSIRKLNISNGLAKGKDGHNGAGASAGMGGGLFIDEGNGKIAGKPGIGGKSLFGGSNGGVGYSGSGAGLGGAIFIRSGQLILAKTTFIDNQAMSSASSAIADNGINPGQGKGSAIFIVTPALTQQANRDHPPLVASLKSLPEFSNNFATDADQSPMDNYDVYGEIAIN